MLRFRALAGFPPEQLGRPLAAVTLAMSVGAGLAGLWWIQPGVLSLLGVLITAGVTGWLALRLMANTPEADDAVRDEARRLESFRTEIVTTVSHELRTPLTVIQGLTAVLDSRWDQLPEARKLDLIDSLQLNVASLDASILHFVDAGRLVRGEYCLAPEQVELAGVVEPVLAKLSGMLAGHDVQVELAEGTAWADPEALGRILELLLANCVRFSELGTLIALRISRGGDGSIALSVADRGIGIAPHHLPHVFEPFWRAEVSETGVSRGAGLGLFIVKELAERHGGTVHINSTRGRGTTVMVSLPGPHENGGTKRRAETTTMEAAPLPPVSRAPRVARPGRVRLRQTKASAIDHLLGRG